MKAKIHKVNYLIKRLITLLASILGVSPKRYPMTKNIQVIISHLQEAKKFGKIGRELSRKLKFEGLVVIEKLSNAMLRLEMENDNILANGKTMSIEKAKSEDCISLLKMVIQMKTKEAVEEKIAKGR